MLYVATNTLGHSLPVGVPLIKGGMHPDNVMFSGQERGDLYEYCTEDNLFRTQWLYDTQIVPMVQQALIGGE